MPWLVCTLKIETLTDNCEGKQIILSFPNQSEPNPDGDDYQTTDVRESDFQKAFQTEREVYAEALRVWWSLSEGCGRGSQSQSQTAHQ